ncbi:hypothetical protein ACFLWA_12280 [Chloroflexota bacterium]
MTWARTAITGMEPDLVDWDRDEMDIDPAHDAVITRMAENGLTITYVLMFWDKEDYPGGVGAPCARFKTEAEIEHYLAFVEFMVDHFKDRVQRFEIWNEPDIAGFCPKWVELEDYVNLVEQAVPVIRGQYAEAEIVVGSVSNTRFADAHDYLSEVVQSDIMPLVDVVAWHPMYGTSPAYGLYRDYYYGYPDYVQQIKNDAAQSGFAGKFQADEVGWATPATAVPDQPWVYSPTVAQKYYGRGILMHLGMDVGIGLPDDYPVVRNLCTLMAGAQALSLPVAVQTTMSRTVTYTFSYTGGENLVAVWTDGVAVEHDPGVTATLTLPGSALQRVMAVDVLHGFEQEILTGEEEGALVVRDLLVKDYPIVLRLIPPRRSYLPTVPRR